MTVTALYGLASTERLHTFERVCQLSESIGDASALFRGLLNLGFAYAHRLEARLAQEIARRCVKLTEEDLSEAAYTLLTQALHRSGNFLQAASMGNEARKGLTSAHHPAAGLVPANMWAVNPVFLASVEHALGRPDVALKFANEALGRAWELKHSLSLAAALHMACLLRYQRREPEAARELAEALIALSEEHGFREFLVAGKAFRAWAMTERGQTEQGVGELETLATPARRFFNVSKSMMLADVYLHVGRAEDAIVTVGEELAAIEQSGAHQEAAELHRLKGEAILMRDSLATAEAEACFRKAIEVAIFTWAAVTHWVGLGSPSMAATRRCSTGGEEASIRSAIKLTIEEA